jgi:tRNA threonylcarbamoyladenosine biosynthesis protein TsaB
MIILTIRTDKPEAEVGLFDDEIELKYISWHAHRELSLTLNQKIDEVLAAAGKQLADIAGIVCFKGPGSFTGLRIGMSVANALAYALAVLIVAEQGNDWVKLGIEKIARGQGEKIVVPDYGGPARTTSPKK